jgi:hypothetical protein
VRHGRDHRLRLPRHADARVALADLDFRQARALEKVRKGFDQRRIDVQLGHGFPAGPLLHCSVAGCLSQNGSDGMQGHKIAARTETAEHAIGRQ